jgi:hypothetical protein
MRPNVLEVKPLTRVRHCEHALRCWIRGEPGPHIERAIAELIIAAVTQRLNSEDAPACENRGGS